jgi:hypothetical protein
VFLRVAPDRRARDQYHPRANTMGWWWDDSLSRASA